MACSEQHRISAVMDKKVVGRPWPQGRSGNPGGRPRAALDIQALARGHTTDAIRALVAALSNPRERVAAAVALLDRGWGKPVTTIEGNVEHTTYVLRAPSPIESADEWLRLHAPSDSRTDPAIDGKLQIGRASDMPSPCPSPPTTTPTMPLGLYFRGE